MGPTMHKEREPKKTVYRDSTDGQFTRKKFAENNPRITEKERVPVRPPAAPPKPKK